VRSGRVVLGDDPVLDDITAFANVEITGLRVENLPTLANLSDLTGAKLSDLTVKKMPLLQMLAELQNMEPIVSTLTITDNAALSSIEALHAVRQVDTLDVENNPVLVPFRGLDGLTTTTSSTNISNNPRLPECELATVFALNPRSLSGGNDDSAKCQP
jgi:hypothetical protein